MANPKSRGHTGTGKHLDTWQFSVADKTREVKVYLHRSSQRDAKYTFRAETVPAEGCTDFKSEHHEDVNKLYEWAKEEIDKTVNLEWEKSLIILLDGDDGTDNGIGTITVDTLAERGFLKFSLRFEFMVKDIARRGGKVFVRDNRGSINIIQQVVWIDKGGHIVVLPWTQEKEDALKVIRDKFIALHAGLKTLLEKPVIEDTLKKISDKNLLTF